MDKFITAEPFIEGIKYLKSVVDNDIKEAKESVTTEVFVHNYDKTNLSNALALAFADNPDSTTYNCSYFNVNNFPDGITIDSTINITKPMTLKFGSGTFNYSGNGALFNITSKAVTIIGNGRVSDFKDVSYGTIFNMSGESSNTSYHILSTISSKYLVIKDCSLIGRKSTKGTLDGVGGIYIEKNDPTTTGSGNNCSNIIIENVYIQGTRASGIYINTPIVSKIVNVRVSNAGTNGIFIEQGTSIMFENVYAASAQYIGFHIKDTAYSTLLNCVSEECALGFWFRSGRNISVFNPGVEDTNASKSTENIYVQSPTTESYQSKDIPNEYGSVYFNGTGILISGGWGISIFSPYMIHLNSSLQVAYIKVIEANRCSSLSNLYFPGADDTVRRHDIYIAAEVKGLDVLYDISETKIADSTGKLAKIVTDAKTRGAICNLSDSTLIHAGNIFYTPINTPS